MTLTDCLFSALRDRLAIDASGPNLPVDITVRCLAALSEADVGPYCSILAMQMTAVRTVLPLAGVARSPLAGAA
jgi:hypothetical protein